MKEWAGKLVLVLILVFTLAIGSNTAIAAKSAGTISVVLTDLVGETAYFDVDWSKYPAYSAVAMIYVSGYMIATDYVMNDGKTHRTYSATGCTLSFGQNAVINENILPLSGKYFYIVFQLKDRKGGLIVSTTSSSMLIP